MRPMLCAMLALVILLGSFACAEGGAIIEEVGGAGVDAPYEMRIYDKAANKASAMSIAYPWFTDSKYDWLNDIIREHVVEIAVLAPYNRMAPNDKLVRSVDYTCKVTLLNDNVMSAMFYGSTYFAPPENSYHYGYYGLTVDLATKQELALTDIYNTDSEFVGLVYDQSRSPTNPLTGYDSEIYIFMMGLYKYNSKYGNLLTRWPSDVRFYLVDNGIVLLLSSHNARMQFEWPFFEAYLNYKGALPFYKMDNSLWDEPGV